MSVFLKPYYPIKLFLSSDGVVLPAVTWLWRTDHLMMSGCSLDIYFLTNDNGFCQIMLTRCVARSMPKHWSSSPLLVWRHSLVCQNKLWFILLISQSVNPSVVFTYCNNFWLVLRSTPYSNLLLVPDVGYQVSGLFLQSCCTQVVIMTSVHTPTLCKDTLFLVGLSPLPIHFVPKGFMILFALI